MLVRDRGESWQLVRQPDHADLSGQLAQAWGGGAFAPLDPAASAVLAATRHDDGWAVFDRRPAWDAERQRPRNFLDVPILAHLAFYRACIEVVTEEDPYAGMLVAMHGAGIYTGRYGTDSSSRPTLASEEQAAVDVFVGEQEERYGELAERLGVEKEDRWRNYLLLQTFDRLSLSFCLREWESSDAGADAIGPVPVGAEPESETELRIEPIAPWRVSVDPYPFAESPARFSVVRKLLLKAPFADNLDFRRAYFGTRAELVEIVAERVTATPL